MKTIKTFFNIIALIVAISISIVIIFSFTGLILAFVGGILVLCFALWLCGYPVRFSQDVVPIG